MPRNNTITPLVLIALAGLAFAQDAQPPAQPQAQPQTQPQTQPAAPTAITPLADPAVLNRRPTAPGETILAFPRATVEQVVPFIVESTGKVVIPQQEVLARRITVVNDKPIPRAQALDLVFFALQQVGVAVIESDTFILLRDQADIDRQPVPVLGPSASTLERQDLGSIFQKVFSLKYASASNVADIVKLSLPDTAKIIADNDSLQVIVTAPVAILQRIERIISALDRPPPDLPKSETFKLQYADAESIANSIRELYSDAAAARNRSGGQNQNQNQGGNQNRNAPGGRQPGGNGNQGGQIVNAESGSGARAQANPTSSVLRVNANLQQNAVTVIAEANILAAIRKQIEEEWDKPLPQEVVTPRVYNLKYTDPIKVRTVLEGLFGAGTTGGGTRQTVGRLAGQFTFQAVPEASRIVVVGKSPDNLEVIDRIIADLDQPILSGLPEVIELKHVQAEDLAEQLNALLAQEGTFAQIRRTSTELSETNSGASPFANSGNGQFDTNTFARETPTDVLQFWWQRARPATDNSGASNLVAKARIVPIAKQNSILILAPNEYRIAVAKLVDQLDKPGRQVLIAAVIAEISSEDALALGLRTSNTAITPTNQDNAIGIGPSGTNVNTFTGTRNDLADTLFNSSVLNVGVNINALLQALKQKTSINILSEPKIFTGDNQEAGFFDGQDIPFITDSERNNNGNLVQSFDYRAVGINLRVRPRITPERDVDLKVNLELSSIQPSQTLFGGFIVDRRQTSTQVIIRDGQTVIVSGIIRTEDSDITRKVPFFGDIPLIGSAFTSTERSKTTTELVAFITPIVINNQSDSDRINNPARGRLGELRTELSADQPQTIIPTDPAQLVAPGQPSTPGAADPTTPPTPTPPPTPSPAPPTAPVQALPPKQPLADPNGPW
jgi:type II secretion system protein D